MATSFVLHDVADYAKWRQVYDSVSQMQQDGGVVEEAVYQSPDNPNKVLVMHRFSTMEQAQNFFGSSPALRDAMAEAGVDMSSLRVEIYNEA